MHKQQPVRIVLTQEKESVLHYEGSSGRAIPRSSLLTLRTG